MLLWLRYNKLCFQVNFDVSKLRVPSSADFDFEIYGWRSGSTRTPLVRVRFPPQAKFKKNWNKIFESRILGNFCQFIFRISSYSEIQPNRDAHSFWLILIIMIWNQYYWMIMFYLVLCLFTNAQINWKYRNIILQCQESFLNDLYE